MRAFSPSSSNRALFVVGTVGALLVLVVAFTGGFVLDAGLFRLSVRSWVRPLVLAALAFAVLVRRAGSSGVAAMAAQVWPFLERHAAAIAVVLAAGTAGDGIAHGSYAAAGSDAGGYISQAELIAHGRLSIRIPLSQEVNWPLAVNALAPLGYRPGLNPGELVPTYPPGLPLVMAAAQRLGGSDAPFLVAPLLGALAVFCAFALGRRLHSPAAGLVAAALLSTSPVLLFQLPQAMSDVPATAWWALALLLASRGSTAGAGLAGLSAGLGFVTRPALLPLLLPVSLTLFFRSPKAWHSRSLLQAVLLAGFAPWTIGLAVLQQQLYGTPFGSGHGTFAEMFGPQNIAPNLDLYVDRLLTGETAALVLLLTSVAGLVVRRPRRTTVLSSSLSSSPLSSSAPSSFGPLPSPSPLVPLVIGASSLAVVLFCYLPYGVFAEFSYLRFLMPAFPALFVGIGALAATACLRAPSTLRGWLLCLVIVLVCSFNIVEAARQEAFLIRRTQARYQITGRYLEAMLPERAVVIAAEESTSIHHYTGVPIVRWDLVDADLDTVVHDLTALGRHPVLVLEDHEERLIREKFPQSSLSRLDWRPRADIGDHVHVRVYDPAEREAGPHGRTDRIHAP
jgi:hypothetical protein